MVPEEKWFGIRGVFRTYTISLGKDFWSSLIIEEGVDTGGLVSREDRWRISPPSLLQ